MSCGPGDSAAFPGAALAQLLKPFPAKAFLARYWERKPLCVKRPLPAWATGLVSLHDVDAILATGQANPNDVRLVKTDGSKVDHAEVPRLADGSPNVAAICEAYHNGYTVVLNALHRRWPAVASLRADLCDDLGHPVGINLYLT